MSDHVYADTGVGFDGREQRMMEAAVFDANSFTWKLQFSKVTLLEDTTSFLRYPSNAI